MDAAKKAKRVQVINQQHMPTVDIRILNSFTDLRRRVEVAKRLLNTGHIEEAYAELDGHVEAGGHIVTPRKTSIREHHYRVRPA